MNIDIAAELFAKHPELAGSTAAVDPSLDPREFVIAFPAYGTA